MITIILPGFSEHGKKWIDYLFDNLKINHQIKAIYWEHWKTGGGIKLKKELEKISKIIGDEKINIIAKSVGTMVCMNILKIHKQKINKIIFCGIPSVGQKRLDLMKESLVDMNPKNIICIQNTFDPFVKSKDLVRVMKSVNKKIVVLEKEAKNHDYYYVEDFNNFLNK